MFDKIEPVLQTVICLNSLLTLNLYDDYESVVFIARNIRINEA